MTRSQVWLVHLSNLLVSATGLAWAAFLFLVEPADEFALQNHPLQDEAQAAHVLAAPLLVLALGLVWALHARPHLVSGERARRSSGLALLALAAPVVASGYLLQVAVDEGWRTVLSGVHVVTSLLWVAASVAHQLARRRRAPSAERDRARAEPERVAGGAAR